MTYLERSVESAEKNAEFLLKYQITDPQSPDFGGYYNKGFGVVAENGGASAGTLIDLYFCPQSRYYRDPAVLRCADGLVCHLKNHLH